MVPSATPVAFEMSAKMNSRREFSLVTKPKLMQLNMCKMTADDDDDDDNNNNKKN